MHLGHTYPFYSLTHHDRAYNHKNHVEYNTQYTQCADFCARISGKKKFCAVCASVVWFDPILFT